MTRWTSNDIPDQTGRTVLVSGANSGLGLRSAEALATAGARVLMGCRNEARASVALEMVGAVATGPAPEVVALDLADLDSVRGCADRVSRSVDALDVLMNNAGVMAVPYGRTADGFELHLGTNHLGAFALTGLLLPALLRSVAPRVVTTSSNMHRVGRIRIDDLTGEGSRYNRWWAYGRSKLANLLFTLELDRRARSAGTGLVAAAAHPGYAATHLQSTAGGWQSRVMALGNRLVAQSDRMGALPQLYAATMPGVGGGSYHGPDGLFGLRGHPTLASPSARAKDPAVARRLWERSEKLTGVSYPWPRR